ncbi:hypothetical protein [Mesorhizobium sp. M0220]
MKFAAINTMPPVRKQKRYRKLVTNLPVEDLSGRSRNSAGS